MSNMETVRQLVSESDAAARRAAKIVKSAHYQALSEAESVLKGLKKNLSDGERRNRLMAMLKASATSSGMSEAVAANVIAQTPEMALPNTSGISSRRNGTTLFRAILTGTGDWPTDQRKKAIHALTLGLYGLADTGLIAFPSPSDLANELGIDELEGISQLVAPAAFQDYREEMQELAARHLEAERIVMALKRGEPQLYVTTICQKPGKETCATIKNTMADLGIGGVHLAGGGAVTKLSLAEYVKVEQHSIFQAQLASGALSIEMADNLTVKL
ncbi:MAG: hypothetical protein P1U64_04030 [Alcanivoracaceae bacterium]|nr:hypothetical protein [Alcanivoracaceae bacterium]